ncbi:MAG: hypothetical protein O3B84_03415 [Chloroflexi bacterium]|nr:hypothetical protein [Chloroflexota bacterium]
MLGLSLEYSAFVFAASIGTLQVAAAYSGLQGALFFGSRRVAAAFGCIILALSFIAFFGSVDRNIRGLEGAEQTLLFLPSAMAAVVFTLVGASLRYRLRRQGLPPGGGAPLRSPRNRQRGLDALRSMSYLDAVLEEEKARR